MEIDISKQEAWKLLDAITKKLKKIVKEP